MARVILVCGRDAKVWAISVPSIADRWGDARRPNRHHCFIVPVKSRVMFARLGILNCQCFDQQRKRNCSKFPFVNDHFDSPSQVTFP